MIKCLTGVIMNSGLRMNSELGLEHLSK